MKYSAERTEWRQKRPDDALSKILKIITWVLTGLVFILVGLMRRPDLRIPLPDGVDLDFLPPVHAAINTAVAICLVAALIAISAGDRKSVV